MHDRVLHGVNADWRNMTDLRDTALNHKMLKIIR